MANKQAEQQVFEQLSKSNAVGLTGKRWVDRLFRPLFAGFSQHSSHWQQDAANAIDRQKELRARGLLYVIAITFMVLLVWAAFAPIDEVTRGEGKVIPSRQLQIVQSLDGGMIEELLIKEGDQVTRGQLLARIDPTRFVANLEESSTRLFSLTAKVERLTAQINNQPYELAFSEELTAEQQRVLKREQNHYLASLNELKKREAVVQEQIAQRQQELSETQARLLTAGQAYRMSSKELAATRPLLATGAVSEIDILHLQRDQSAANGERRQAAARAEQVKASIQEAQARLQEVKLTMHSQWHSDLSNAATEMNSLTQQVDGLADRVKLADIRSPVNGTVQRVLLNTVGGVVQPGNALVEIVPSDDRLLVEARIAPKDIAFLRPGLPATIKLHAYDFAIYGGLEAQLQHISADTMTDERDNTFYLVRAITTNNDSTRDLSVIPGMTAQLDVMTGKRTVLSYLLKPLLRAKANALSER
ncbi:HlyD family type I secretion periplasmic adaptor subunit [Oceanisphaera sp.]|uniref:HlyD family type I secretion periplasmic adaptor subunit n=1 Tax=Oceanisphaera sp. TaxID=1929979 RepID=UPI003A8D2CC4